MPILGAEKATGTAVLSGWSEDVSDEQISEWTKTGLALQDEMEAQTMSVFTAEYNRLMRKVIVFLIPIVCLTSL